MSNRRGTDFIYSWTAEGWLYVAIAIDLFSCRVVRCLACILGLAGFSNGEAQKAGAEFPKFRPQRYFFRQHFVLAGSRKRSKAVRTSSGIGLRGMG